MTLRRPGFASRPRLARRLEMCDRHNRRSKSQNPAMRRMMAKALASALLVFAFLAAARPVEAAGFCTMLWAPVCALKDGAEKTYSNAGCAKADDATVTRQGPMRGQARPVAFVAIHFLHRRIRARLRREERRRPNLFEQVPRLRRRRDGRQPRRMPSQAIARRRPTSSPRCALSLPYTATGLRGSKPSRRDSDSFRAPRRARARSRRPSR